MESQIANGAIALPAGRLGSRYRRIPVLLLRRSLLASHEDDQSFSMRLRSYAQEQRELVAKINALSRPIMGTGILAGVLLLVIAGMWLKED